MSKWNTVNVHFYVQQHNKCNNQTFAVQFFHTCTKSDCEQSKHAFLSAALDYDSDNPRDAICSSSLSLSDFSDSIVPLTCTLPHSLNFLDVQCTICFYRHIHLHLHLYRLLLSITLNIKSQVSIYVNIWMWLVFEFKLRSPFFHS